jgi:hypothetical protein
MAQKKKNKKGRLSAVRSNELLERIENLVSKAYEIGYDHGGNIMRATVNQPPKSLNKGWGPIAIEIQRIFKKYAV